MLYKYKKDYEKIVMGFLSYLSDFKNIRNLQDEMKLYNRTDEYQVFLYRPEPDQDFVGIAGIQMTEQFVMLRYISLAPNYRDQDNCFHILADLERVFPNDNVLATPEYAKLVSDFARSKNG